MKSKELFIVIGAVLLMLMGSKAYDAYASRHDEPYDYDNKELEAYKERIRYRDSMRHKYEALEDSLAVVLDERELQIDSLETELFTSMDKMRELTNVVVTLETKKKAKKWIEEHNRSLSSSQ